MKAFNFLILLKSAIRFDSPNAQSTIRAQKPHESVAFLFLCMIEPQVHLRAKECIKIKPSWKEGFAISDGDQRELRR